MAELEGKVAVILGASTDGGVGWRTAELFAAQGAKVVVSARTPAPLEELASRLGGKAVVCDITDEGQVSALADAAVEAYGRVDLAVNATGEPIMGSIDETDGETLERATAVHFYGPFYFIKHMARHMPKGGSIITISSITATLTLHNHAAYMGAKAGTDHLVRIAALEYGPQQVRVNSVSPGFMDTPMTTEFIAVPGLVEAFEKETPLGRIATAQDIAEACLWLSSDKAFVTGQNLQVNGGASLRRLPTPEELAP